MEPMKLLPSGATVQRGGGHVDVLLWDWGGTLVGPGGRLSQGVREALEALNGKVRMAVATNAEQPQAVDASLERWGLRDRFCAVHAAGELGVAKPAASFYRSVLARCGVRPRRAAMVGDAYLHDVVAAKGCRLRSFWYNPGSRSCPAVHPAHDGEVRSLKDLPTILEAVPLPDLAECMRLLRRSGPDRRLIRHSLAVAGAAFRLAEVLRDRGVVVDPLLVHRGGLLHDLDKISTLDRGGEHGSIAASWLRRAGQPALAMIVQRHVTSALLEQDRCPLSWEEKVVHYVDKLVQEDVLVGLRARWEGLRERYPQYGSVLEASYPKIRSVEQELADVLGDAPEHVLARLTPQRGGWR